MKLHVIMACHNRKELSLSAVKAATVAAAKAGIPIDFTIYDDGSTDGTTEALMGLNQDIEIIKGDGTAYWAKSMATSETTLLSRADVLNETESWVVWLNDDVKVDQTAFSSVAHLLAADLNLDTATSVLVGAMRDPRNGEITYGGYRKTGLHPLRFKTVMPSDLVQTIDSFNGNLVFIPVSAARKVGGIDGVYSHSLADIDYGLQCRRYNIPLLLLPNTLGTCARNPPGTETRLPDKWKQFVGPKGAGNYGSLRRILKKNNPLSWPVFLFVTYLLWFFRNVFPPGLITRPILNKSEQINLKGAE